MKTFYQCPFNFLIDLRGSSYCNWNVPVLFRLVVRRRALFIFKTQFLLYLPLFKSSCCCLLQAISDKICHTQLYLCRSTFDRSGYLPWLHSCDGTQHVNRGISQKQRWGPGLDAYLHQRLFHFHNPVLIILRVGEREMLTFSRRVLSNLFRFYLSLQGWLRSSLWVVCYGS